MTAPYRRAPRRGLSTGWIVALVLGGAAAICSLVGVVGLVAMGASSSDPPPAPVISVSLPGLVHPDQAARDRYLAALAAIDPELVDSPDRAVSHGREICFNLAEGDAERAVRLAAERDGVPVAMATRIVEAARRELCPG